MKVRRIVSVVSVAVALPLVAHASPPDLCEDVVLAPDGSPYTDSQDATISKWCAPHTDPPTWGGDVCCVITDEANCMPPDPVGRCAIGMKFSCEYGEQIGDGVVCYQPGPSACEAGFCQADELNGKVFTTSSWLCCDYDYVCTYVGEGGMNPPEDAECDGSFAICNYGATNEDGTVDCLD